ncbi:MAG: ribulose phosphate epimerase [Nannocystis sp.]|nr:ribulose phosphate epimerase [Nannocystis sp.]MBA3545080.1 ribulose phosphate epimerase [Nannocystis sp.]
MNGRIALLLGSLAGCNPELAVTATDVGSTAVVGSDSVSSTITPTSTGAATTSTTSGMSSTTGAPAETGGIDEQCEPRAQNCREGLKCTAYSENEFGYWDANKCVPVTGDGVYGEPCEVQGGPLTGFDDCAKGFLCVDSDDDGKDGVCLEFCRQDNSCPFTNGGASLCPVSGDGTLPLCLGLCDPLLQDCPGTQGCYGDPSGPPFFCYGPDPKDGGMDGSKCEFTNACLGGLHCMESSRLEGCPPDSLGCCTPFCALDGDECTGAEVCVAFFTEPWPGLENVGLCALPG